MPNGQADSGVVIARNRWPGNVFAHPIDEDHRYPGISELFDEGCHPASGGKDQTVDPPAEHRSQDRRFFVRVVIGIAQDQGVISLAEGVLDTPHDRRKEGVGQIGEQHPDRVRTIGLQSSGQ